MIKTVIALGISWDVLGVFVPAWNSIEQKQASVSKPEQCFCVDEYLEIIDQPIQIAIKV